MDSAAAGGGIRGPVGNSAHEAIIVTSDDSDDDVESLIVNHRQGKLNKLPMLFLKYLTKGLDSCSSQT